MKKIIFVLLPLVVLVFLAFSPGDKHTVSGTVSDQNGAPVIGASIIVKGTNTGTSSDQNGGFSIQASDSDVLVVSQVGFTTEEIKINKRSVVNVTLAASSAQLETVVVTASGIKRSEK